MVKCCVESCRSNSKFSSPDITYHRLPDSRCFPNLYKKWLHKITGAPEDAMVDFIAQGTSRVCSLHFTEDDFAVKTDRNRTRRTLRVEALPTQRLPLFCRALKAEMADPFAIKFPDFVNGSLRVGSPMCNNNNDPSSPSKCMMLNDMSPRNNGNELTITKVTKRIKVERGTFQPRNRRVQASYRPEECEISPTSFQTPEGDVNEDPETHIPACYRGKKNVYSPYAFSITELESELGFKVIMINENKYLKCDPAEEDYQIWRCIIRNCCSRVATAPTHCSILIGLFGVHYHLPTKDIPLDPGDWAPGTPWTMDAEDDGAQSDGTPWSPDVGRDSGCEQSPVTGDMSPWGRQQCNQGSSPPHLQSDTRFNVRDLLAPGISQFQLPNSQQPQTITYQAFSSLDLLSKFCGGQVIQRNPFNGSRSEGDTRIVDEQDVVSETFPEMEGVEVSAESHPEIVDSRSLSNDEQAEYILPSPGSERNNAMTDGTSEVGSQKLLNSWNTSLLCLLVSSAYQFKESVFTSNPSTEEELNINNVSYLESVPEIFRSLARVKASSRSRGSSSERTMSARMEEPSFYELVDVVDVHHVVDVHDIVQKDPLALEENSHQKPDNDQPPISRRASLKEEDAAFFQTLGPHLDLLSAQNKEVFRKKVMDIISHMCKKDSFPRYGDSQDV